MVVDMRILTDEQKKVLNKISIIEIEKYIDNAGKIPLSLQDVGIETLFDLFTTDIRQLKTKSGFSRKKSEELQKKIRKLSDEVFDTIIFFGQEYVFPIDYNSEDGLLGNVDKVLKDILWYLNECIKRKGYVNVPSAYHKRVSDLYTYLKDVFIEGKDMQEVADIFRCKYETIRQRLIVNFIAPLFNGKSVATNNLFLKNISICSKLLEETKGLLFCHTQSEPSFFVKNALNIDCAQLGNNLGYIIVPKETTLCYECLNKVILDELSKVQKPITIEELLEAIRVNKKTIKDISQKGKEYSEEFVHTLVYDSGLTLFVDNKVIIKPEYINVQERGIARIVADAAKPITREEIKEEYYRRYNVWLDNFSMTRSKLFGCVPNGKTHWGFRVIRIDKQEWVEAYAKDKEMFFYNDIYQAITEAGYPINRGTLRTYITNCCSVDNNNANHFCYRNAVQSYRDYNWAESPRSGIINWLANELKLFFEQKEAEKIHIKEIDEWLYERGKGTEYEEDNVYAYSRYLVNSTISSEPNSPFFVEAEDRGSWYLVKNMDVYNTIDWGNFAKRGKEHEHKLIALATNIVRKSRHFRVSLMDLAREIYEGGYLDGWGIMKIRMKLIYFIANSETKHTLNLQKTDDRLIVSIDARKIDKASRYAPVSREVRIEYKTISQIATLDWSALTPILYKELSFCSEWLQNDKLCNYDEAFDRFENLIRKSGNKNLCSVFPQKIYEFFFVSDPTDNDRYLIMCSIAKNFEALLKEIHFRNGGYNCKCDGLYNLTVNCGFDDFTNILDSQTKIYNLLDGSYQKALKFLSLVRNTDSHGQWYVDDWRGDTRSETEKNIEKIKNFAALYIFAVAKYLE